MEVPPSSSSPSAAAAAEVNDTEAAPTQVAEGLEAPLIEKEIAPDEPSSSSSPPPPVDAPPDGVIVRPSLDEVWESIKSKEEEEGPVLLDEAPKASSSLPERVRPSSLRTRPSTRAKRNVTFKDDFEKVEEEGTEERVERAGARWPPRAQRRGPPPPVMLPPACLGLFLAVALASLVVYLSSPKIPTKPQLWTSAELEKYKGSDNRPPLLLGIMGSVFDVSKGWKHYGPGGSYHHFVGRDASRAFVSGNFTDDGLTDSLEGLTPAQIKAIDDWRLFFHSRYVYLGKLVGTFYNSEGVATKKLHLAEKEVKKAAQIEKQQKLDEERFPNCNSRWTQDQGGEVWCTDGKYPRITELVTKGPQRGPPRTRCACLAQEELHRLGAQEYEGCDALSSRCKT